MSETKLKGPYETELRVHVTNGKKNGCATVNLTCGEPPTKEQVKECLLVAEESVKESGYRLMNKREFFNAMTRERLGINETFACPGNDEWDD